jgi:GxxExxY protein
MIDHLGTDIPLNFGGLILEQMDSLTDEAPHDDPVVGSERWTIKKANEIYITLGRGYPECVYHRAFEYELRTAGIPYESEKLVPICYKGNQVGNIRADMIVGGDYPMVLEFKAISGNVGIRELEQLGRYMKHLNIDVGIVINFLQPSATAKGCVDFIVGRKEQDNYES